MCDKFIMFYASNYQDLEMNNPDLVAVPLRRILSLKHMKRPTGIYRKVKTAIEIDSPFIMDSRDKWLYTDEDIPSLMKKIEGKTQ